MDIRDKKLVWIDQEVFDVPEAVGITASKDFLIVLRDKLVAQLNHFTIVAQLIPDIQKEVSILEMYISKDVKSTSVDKWRTDLITKQNELDHLVARKEVLVISIGVLQTIMESIQWELKE